MTSSPAPAVPLDSDDAVPVTFAGRARDFVRMLVTGTLLLLPTFGFYRFWLVTRLRRHLWAHTRIGSEAFEYTGTAKELLIGALIALAVLTPIYVVYFIIGTALEEQQVLASLPLALVLWTLAHFASYRARRYRATRTVFRGVRFWMTGTGWGYAGRALLWDVATVLSLGLALPWAKASLERYRMRHTFFGTLRGDFTGSGTALFKRGAWVWALGVLIVFVPGLVALGLSQLLGAPDADDMDKAAQYHVVVRLIPFLSILAPITLLPLAMAIFTRWQMEGIRFGGVTVASKLGKGAFYGPCLKLVGTTLGWLLVFGGIAGGAIYHLSESGGLTSLMRREAGWDVIAAIVLVVAAYLALFLGMGCIQRYFMGRGLWAVVVSSLAVSNLQAAEDAAAASDGASTAVGEGLADALDFDMAI